MQRRTLLLRAGPVLALASTAAWPLAALAAAPMVEIWKDPNCGCCQDLHDDGNTAARARLGVPDKLGSCHTGMVGGYALEGHVPAREVHRLLREKPKAIGLAVPGMPVGSPGMDDAVYGNRRHPYDVLLVLADGGSRVYQSYR